MSTECTVICDQCSGIIAARRDRADAIEDARSVGAIRAVGLDLEGIVATTVADVLLVTQGSLQVEDFAPEPES